MKNRWFMICLLLLVWQAKAQGVFVGLSVRWETNSDTDTVFSIPFLDVSYCNMSGKSYYFPRVGSTYDWEFESYKSIVRVSCQNYSGKDYVVNINFPSLSYFDSWEHTLKSVSFYEEHEMDEFNYSLCDLNRQYFIKKQKKNKANYCQEDLTEENIKTGVKDRFVFLKPNEVFVESFSLLGHYLLKGNFFFVLRGTSFDGSVLLNYVWNEEKGKMEPLEAQLPHKIGEYELFIDDFKSSSVYVSF